MVLDAPALRLRNGHKTKNAVAAPASENAGPAASIASPAALLRYRAVMKKSRSKLTLRKEALLALNTLHLEHVIGGREFAREPFTHPKVCPLVAAHGG